MAPVEVAPDPQQRAKRLFKFVTGVLNKAFSDDRLLEYEADIRTLLTNLPTHLQFKDACDALAFAVEQGQVPTQGLTVLKELLANNSAPSSSLHQAVGVEQKPLAEQCAKQLFSSVSGVLNKAFTPDNIHCESSIRHWFPEVREGKFADACDALACAITDGLVPEKSVEMLAVLSHSYPNSISPKLRTLLHSDEQDTVCSSEKDAQEESVVQEEQADERPKVTASATNRIFKYVTTMLHGGEAEAPSDIEGVKGFGSACNALAECLERGEVPMQGITVLLACRNGQAGSQVHVQDSTSLAKALNGNLCPQCGFNQPRSKVCDLCRGSFEMRCDKCSGTGTFSASCRGCDGTGRGRTKPACHSCGGSGQKVLGSCNGCHGSKTSQCHGCVKVPLQGKARPCCKDCLQNNAIAAQFSNQQRSKGASKGASKGFQKREDGPPQKGVSISKCAAGDLSRLQDLWSSRQAQGQLVAAWKVDNPLLTYRFKERRDQLKDILGREADMLEGFHGSAPANYLSIVDTGFDKGKRGSAVGQVFGSGEYMAKNPTVSIGYCRGGEYMLVCRLTLGVESCSAGNTDGDHIWVPDMGYYVISEPSQILPQFLVKFSGSRSHGSSQSCPKLEAALSNGYSTKAAEAIVPVPERQRPCNMSRQAATVLWMGFLHAHHSDESLRKDVNNFLQTHAAEHMQGAKIQIVKGHYKKAHAILKTPMPKALVHKLNTAPFFEAGTRRTLCVEDAHGSPGQKCPRFIAGYCRGQNLRHTHPCFCSHPPRATEHARYKLEPIDLHGAKGTEILDKFMASAPFHTGQPRIIGIKAIKNETLSKCHEEYRKYLTTKHMEEPAVQELYHGTNNNILEVLYQHGLQPPSDCDASAACPKSGGKGLSTTLCDNTCPHCTKKHEWGRCHMYGLGIYLADMAQKSHRYCSQPQISTSGRQTYRIIVCSVLGKSFQVEGHLRGDRCMHDVVNVRALDEEDLDEMIEPCKATRATRGVGASIRGAADGSCWGRVVSDEGHCWRLHTGRIAKKETEGCRWTWCSTEEVSADAREGSAEKSDLLFVKGLGDKCRPGYSVVNSEYIAFHPHQCLPKYEIEYEVCR